MTHWGSLVDWAKEREFESRKDLINPTQVLSHFHNDRSRGAETEKTHMTGGALGSKGTPLLCSASSQATDHGSNGKAIEN